MLAYVLTMCIGYTNCFPVAGPFVDYNACMDARHAYLRQETLNRRYDRDFRCERA